MKNLFIDSNIWLSLYHFSNNDLNQFSKLQNHLGKNIKLWIPQQVVNEVLRNRDVKIKDALSLFKDWKKPQLPNFCRGYEECKVFLECSDSLEQCHKNWMKKILVDIHNQTLPADKVIGELFASVQTIDCPEQIIRAADLRYNMGNPPGKDGKLGDAINWECLLANIPQSEDLYVISADSDYQSAADKYSFNLFLELEWKEKKHSKIHYYPDLVLFLKEHIEDISLQDERNKEELIRELKFSSSYFATHALIARACEYSDWTADQIENLCEVAQFNSQIWDIFRDPDIWGFYKRCLLSTSAKTENIQKIRCRIFPPPPPPPSPGPPLPRTLPPPPSFPNSLPNN